MTGSGWVPVRWVALGVLLLVAAHLLVSTTFMLYDDEGYVLITYQQFNAGGALYSEIFTQYGPWPYLYHWLAATLLQSPVTHAIGRALTVIHWVAGALGAGWIAGRLTGSRAAGPATTIAAFGLLWQMSSEPSHPGGLIIFTLVIAASAALACLQAARWSRLGVVVGIAGALLLLTKINVGLLFLAGAGCALLHLTRWPAAGGAARLIGAAGLLAVPWALMGPRLGESWVLAFAVLTTVSFVGLLWPARRLEAVIPTACTASAATAFLVTFAAAVLALAARGTPPAALLHGVFVAPLQHPASFMVGLTWPAASWPVALLVASAAIRAGLDLQARGEVGAVARGLLLIIRLGAVAAFVWHAPRWSTLGGVSQLLKWGLPLVPAFLVPLHAGSHRHAPALFLAACLALPQVLHAYPVAGSQMGWGTFLLLPLFAAGLHDAWLALAESPTPWRRRLPAAAWGLMLVATAGQLSLLLHTGWTRYRQSKPAELPGAADLRPGDGARLTLRLMTLNAAVHADRLFSYPGMYSYNLWSGVPTPTARNATHWFWLLSDAEQQAVIDALKASPRGAVVTNDGFDDYLTQKKVPVRGPLLPWIRAGYRPLLRHGHFQFLVPARSPAVPFGIAELLEPAAGQDAEFPALLQTNVVLAGRIDRFVLRGTDHPWTDHATYSAPTARVLFEPISSEGRAVGPAVALPLDHDLRGLYRVHIYAPARPDGARLRASVLTGLDAEGRVLSESVF